MNKIGELRRKYPAYSHKSDEELAIALHKKFHKDLSFEDFARKIGLTTREQKLEEDLEEANNRRNESEKEIAELTEKLREQENELNEKNEEVLDILDKLKNADTADTTVISELQKELANAKRDAKLATDDLSRIQKIAKDFPKLDREIKREKALRERHEKRIKELEDIIRNGLEPQGDKYQIPKTWKECAAVLELSGNDFSMDDVKKAWRKLVQEVSVDKVSVMHEDIKKTALSLAQQVNAAHDYFKNYFKNK